MLSSIMYISMHAHPSEGNIVITVSHFTYAYDYVCVLLYRYDHMHILRSISTSHYLSII